MKHFLCFKVRAHEKMLKDQAKKMNVKSLVANQDNQKSVEIRIAKVAFTIFFLFICAWTPYAIVAMIGAFGDRYKHILSLSYKSHYTSHTQRYREKSSSWTSFINLNIAKVISRNIFIPIKQLFTKLESIIVCIKAR